MQVLPNFASGETADWMTSLFDAIDAKDVDRFLGFLCDDAIFRFGSADKVSGHAGIREAVSAFFASISALEHSVQRTWSGPDSAVCEGIVTYTRLDGSRVSLPFADVFALRDQRIGEYLIYMDIAPLFADSGD